MSLITNYIFNSIYTIYNYIIPCISDLHIENEQTNIISKKPSKSLKEIIKEEQIIMESNNLTREYRLQKIRPNTTHDLYNYKNNMIKISKSEENILDSDKIFWKCYYCNYRIPYYKDLYCSNDKVFCSFNCRDDFLINKINNKINNNI